MVLKLPSELVSAEMVRWMPALLIWMFTSMKRAGPPAWSVALPVIGMGVLVGNVSGTMASVAA